jgi:undecaprenyl-diphosphatase
VPLWIAAMLGLVEGLTEYLPVSSTGHLILVGHWLGARDEASKTFEIVIQAGAILAVVVHYRSLLARRVAGLLRRDPDAVRLATALAVAFVPAAVVGFLFHKAIKHYLFNPVSVAAALAVGGVAMIVIEHVVEKRSRHVANTLEEVDAKRAFVIGLAQCLSLWPGASRAMCTILGGRTVGLSREVAAEFSFLLAIPVLGAATAFDLVKNGKTLLAEPGSGAALAVGFVVSFFVAWAVIATFLRYLRRYGLAPFGVYRIALAALVLVVLGHHPR